MWQYQGNITSGTSLAHTGVIGMKWGKRKSGATSGVSVNQHKMTATERDKYARNRVKKVGARQALDDEGDKLQKTVAMKSGALVGGHMALGGLTISAIAAGMYPLAVATGAAMVANMIGTPMSIANSGKNADRNNNAIKRIADIPDVTTGRRNNTRT